MPPTDRSFLSRPLGFATRIVVRYPVPALVAAVALAICALTLAGMKLGFRTSRLDLLNPQSTYNRLWIEYIDEFGDEDDVVIVVEGSTREEVVPVLEELSKSLEREDRLFSAVLHEVDLSKIRAKGLHYLSVDQLDDISRFLDRVEPIVRGDWSQLNLGNMTSALCAKLEAQGPESEPLAEAAAIEIERLAECLQATLLEPPHYRSPWPEMPQSIATIRELGSSYLLTNQGRLGFVLLRLVEQEDQFARGTEPISQLRQLIDRTAASHPETQIGLTGLPVMEHDEMRSSQTSMLRASAVSLVGVACLFIAGFGGVRHPLLTIVALLLGMAWSFGYITIAVGHLNILSVSFSVILIGLGIDFGVHFVARYLQRRRAGESCAAALETTSRTVGPGIVTGAVTTAIAFFTAGLTEFTGLAELGIIAGGGILLCAGAALFTLPAMIVLADRGRPGRPLAEPLRVDTWVAVLMKFPRVVLVTTLILTALVGLGIGRLWYDHNLLNLQPIGLESVELERKLLTETDQSVWYALSIAEDRNELLARKTRLLELASVERTEEIVSLLPADHGQKRPLIEAIYARLETLAERPPRIPVDPPADLGRVLGRAQQLVASREGRLRHARQLEQIRDALRRMPLADCYARLSYFQQQMAGDLLTRLHAIRGMANPQPPQLSDLPESLVDRFVGKHGHHLLKIYPRANIWDMEALERFVRDVRGVDPRATGNPLQTYEASLQMKRSYEQAAVYSLLAICTVLLLDFGSVRHAVLALIPVFLGAAQMFGLFGLLGIPLNPANMIVLPLILGIGIDDGVHVMHDFRTQSGRYRMSPSTAVSVLVTSLTTIVGFGSLMVASHRGLQSLGRVLAIGVSCCLFTSLVMLPALLTWMTRNRPDTEPQAAPAETKSAGTPPHRVRHPEPTPATDSTSAAERPRKQGAHWSD